MQLVLYTQAKIQYFDPKTKKVKQITIGHKNIFTYDSEFAKPAKPKATQTKTNKSKASNRTNDYLEKAQLQGVGKTLVLRQKVNSLAEAEKKAKAALREKNKAEWLIDFTNVGDEFINSGTVIYLEDFGQFNGRYFVENVRHTISKNGYISKVSAYRILGDTPDE